MTRTTQFSSRRKMSGFTLVELMIVVAIIGILAGVAVPQYQVYVVRSKIAEAISNTAIYKTAISEYIMTKGTWPPSVAASGAPATVQLSYLQSVASYTYGGKNFLVITVSGVNNEVDGKFFALISNFDQGGGISKPLTWYCASPNSSLTGLDPIVSKYMPSVCRQAF